MRRTGPLTQLGTGMPPRTPSGQTGPGSREERLEPRVWREGETWSGHCFFLGTNKEVFDAETFAIYRH